MGSRQLAPTERLLEGFCPDAAHGRLRVETVDERRAGRCDACGACWDPEYEGGRLAAVRFLVRRGDDELVPTRADLGSLDRGLPIADYVAYGQRRAREA